MNKTENMTQSEKKETEQKENVSADTPKKPAPNGPTLALSIRALEKEDLDRLYFLDQRAYAEPYRFQYHRLLATLGDRDVGTVVVAELDAQEKTTQLRGALMVKGDTWKRRLTVLTLMVDPPFRRKGLGRRLMDHALRVARGYNFVGLDAPMENENQAGKDFLKALGFAPTEGFAPYFADAAQGVVWARPLNAGESAGQPAGNSTGG
ncbi:MAG: GNAT family N-acetyltransferase [Deltaproteobacteria bacterium]|nr:GNAT family N-acetyltransferase [Deltaproteobacteria bacterium]